MTDDNRTMVEKALAIQAEFERAEAADDEFRDENWRTPAAALEVQEDLAYELADLVHAREAARWSPDDLAYDGSAWPMRRDLTPRERDVLTRILAGWWHRLIELATAERGDRLASYATGTVRITREMLNDPTLAWMRMSVEECQMLLDLRAILNPRQD